MSSIEASEMGSRLYKSSLADRMVAGTEGSQIRKRGERRTEITIPLNGDEEGPSVLISLENGDRRVRFHHHGTIYLNPHP